MAALRRLVLSFTKGSKTGTFATGKQQTSSKATKALTVVAAGACAGAAVYYCCGVPELTKSQVKSRLVHLTLPAVSAADKKQSYGLDGRDVYMSSYENRFRLFSSLEYEGQLYMTPLNFVESVTLNEPRKHRNKFMSKTFMEYAATEADPDDTVDFTQCHLKEKLNDLISKSQETINNILMYVHKNVAPLAQKFLYKTRYEIDHVLVHIRSFLKSLKIHHYSVPKDMDNKLQGKLEDIKKDAEKQIKHTDPKAMQQALLKKMQEMKDDVKKDVKKPVHHKDDSKDLKKDLENLLEDFEKRLLHLTKDYERKVDTKTHNIFQKHDKGHNKKDKPNKPENKPSCTSQRDQIDNLWDSFCKKYR